MSKPLLPPIESFSPEESPPTLACAEIAFSMLSNFGMKSEEIQGGLNLRTILTDRVDAVDIEPTDIYTAIRLRSAPWLPMVDSDQDQSAYIRDFSVATIEVGELKIDPEDEYPIDPEGDELEDSDYTWTATIAIIVDMFKDASEESIFICNAQTGKELTQTEKTELQFLLTYLQQNLQAEILFGFLTEANEASKTGTVGVNNSIDFDPEDGEFIDGYECKECNIGYGVCEHNKSKLN